MPLTPGYGETPLPHDELTGLIPGVVEILGVPITQAAAYEFEQGVRDQMPEELLTAAIEGSLQIDELLNDNFVRDLHTRLYDDIWIWAGRWRQREVNIGVAPERIAVEVRSCLDNIRHRWEHTDDRTARALGIATHAETVRIHPFVDGNGRITRLLADLVFIAAQDRAEWQYDWDVDKRTYIEMLRGFDVHRNAGELADFIGVQSIES